LKGHGASSPLQRRRQTSFMWCALVFTVAVGLVRPPTTSSQPSRPYSPATRRRALGVTVLPDPSPLVPLAASRSSSTAGGLLGAYNALLDRSAIGVAATQASLMRVAGDRTAQAIAITHGAQTSVHPEHTLAMALIGMFVSGIGGSLWLQALENHVGPTEAMADAVRKAALDFICWAPVANCAYLLGVPYIVSGDMTGALANAQSQFLPTMGLELALYMPYNLLAFSVVPPALRPATAQVACLIFSVLIAMRC